LEEGRKERTGMTKPALWTKTWPGRASKPKARKPVRKVSKKRQRENRQYARAKREWKAFLVGLNCWYCRNCGGKPSDSPHHFRGRAGKLFTYHGFFVPLCADCHDKVHHEQDWARQRGLLCSKGDWGKQP